MMRWALYNVLFGVGYLLVLPRFVYRMCRRGGYRKGILQRLAVYPADLRRRLAERPRIWIHAVSVGEVNVALRFMETLRDRRPGSAFVLTTTTSTGHGIAGEKLGDDDVLLYFPVDSPPIVAKVLAAIRPVAVLLTECELWPNLVRMAKARGIPVMLINGRISAASGRGYRALRCFFGPVLQMIDLLLVQSEKDRERLLAAGAPQAALHVMGSAKMDIPPPAASAAGTGAGELAARLWPDGERLVIVGGSTWEGEEEALLAVYRKVRSDFSNARLILVPRHAERRAAVEECIRRSGLTWVRKTVLDAGGQPGDAEPDVLLLDTTGELGGFYACADIVFVGKSLTQRGGQNFIEPAALGKPVVVGPHLENFQVEAPLFEQAGAFLRVGDTAELERALRLLLEDAAKRSEYGQRALAVVESGRGAVSRSVDLVLERLPASNSPANKSA